MQIQPNLDPTWRGSMQIQPNLGSNLMWIHADPTWRGSMQIQPNLDPTWCGSMQTQPKLYPTWCGSMQTQPKLDPTWRGSMQIQPNLGSNLMWIQAWWNPTPLFKALFLIECAPRLLHYFHSYSFISSVLHRLDEQRISVIVARLFYWRPSWRYRIWCLFGTVCQCFVWEHYFIFTMDYTIVQIHVTSLIR